jgi:hypothetical protein
VHALDPVFFAEWIDSFDSMLCSACVWRVDQCRKYCAKTDTSTYDSYPYEPGTYLYLYGTGTGTVHDLRLLILVLTTANYSEISRNSSKSATSVAAVASLLRIQYIQSTRLVCRLRPRRDSR